MGGESGTPPKLSLHLQSGRQLEKPPAPVCGSEIWGRGGPKSFGIPLALVLITPNFGLSAWLSFITSRGVNYSRFWNFSLVQFCTGTFSASWFANLAFELNKFKWELLSTRPSPSIYLVLYLRKENGKPGFSCSARNFYLFYYYYYYYLR